MISSNLFLIKSVGVPGFSPISFYDYWLGTEHITCQHGKQRVNSWVNRGWFIWKSALWHSHAPCLYGAIPGHLYSFLACAISPLLKRVRWPIAGRMPLSSREGRMVSRNIPLKKIRSKPHISHPIKAHLLLASCAVFSKLKSLKGEIHQCWALNSVQTFKTLPLK